MKSGRTRFVELTDAQRAASSAQARTVLLVLVCFLVGLAVGAFWFFRAAQRPYADLTGSALSEGTRAVLKNLSLPLEIRFYALLDPASTSETLREFAGRVDQLLSEYEREGGGKLKVIRNTTRSDATAQAASSDGIKPFNIGQGDACFLGVAVAGNDQKETLAQLSPEWEAALESDLSRAIARVSAPKPAARSHVATPARIDPKVIAEVKRALPNLESVSLADATQTLRVGALKEFVDATEAMERAVKAAEQRVSEVQNSGPETDRQTAVKQLQQVQAEHTEKLKQITARLQEQIEALEQIKKEAGAKGGD